MYFPFLRGKQFELEALIELPIHVFNNTIPIIEPVNLPRRPFYTRIGQRGFPFILIVNPYHPQGSRRSMAEIQNLIDTELSNQVNLIVGFLIDGRFNNQDLNHFLNSNPTLQKAVIFRNNPIRTDLPQITASLTQNQVDFYFFDDRNTSHALRSAFNYPKNSILLVDGFQRQDRNSDYPTLSTFDSIVGTWQVAGLLGCGDYVTIGDHFSASGGPVYVVTIHVTINAPGGLEMHHFSSTVNATVKGLPAPKVQEANSLLNASPLVAQMNTHGINIFRHLHATGHNPQLGVLKKASIMHHIELVSSLI